MPENAIGLGELSAKDKPWDAHRREAVSITDFYEKSGNYPQYAERINNCSRWLDFHISDSCIKLSKAFFCRVRFCPICQWRRTMMWKARALGAIPKLLEDYPTSKWLFLTLTVKNVNISDLRESVKKMNAGFNNLRRRKDWPGLGYIKSLEVTKGNDGYMRAHPHIHILIMVKASYYNSENYITQAIWRYMWAECMGLDYAPQVHIEAIKGNVEKGIKETIKYEAKPQDFIKQGYEWLDAMTQQTKKTRRIEVGGLLKKYFKEEDDKEDLIHEAEDSNSEGESNGALRFGWSREAGGYYLNQ